MYIFLTLLFNYLFFKNCYNNAFFIPFFYFLIYFFFTKNIFSLYEYNMLIEDRINIILENIMKVEYNLILLLFIVTCSFFLINSFSYKLYILMFYVFFDLSMEYQIFYFFNLFEFKLNIKLLNGLFLIHPYCIYVFYSSIVIYLISLVYYNYYKFNYRFVYKKINKFQYFLIKFIIIFGLISVILGSWWAYQEINWAGWWSWDLIEIINLLLILYFLFLLHKNAVEYNINYLVNFNIIYLFILLLLISRFNIINSLHSFVVLNNFEQYSYLFFCYIFILFYYILSLYTKDLNLKYFKKVYSLSIFFKIFFNLYVYKIFLELINFMLNYNSFIEFLYFYKNINYIVFMCFSLLWLNFKIYYYFLLLMFSFSELILLFLVFSFLFSKNFNYYKFHFLFLFFIIVVYFKINFLDFSFKSINYNNYVTYINIKINNLFLKKTIWYLNNTWNNINIFFFDVYYIENLNSSIINYSKHCIFSLSNFFLYYGKLLIINNKYFYLYSYILTFFFSLYIFLNIFLIFMFTVKKKLVKFFLF